MWWKYIAFLLLEVRQEFLTRESSVMWSNCILKCRDAALYKFIKDLIYEDKFEHLNSPISKSVELFPFQIILMVVEKICKTVHEAAIKEVIFHDPSTTLAKSRLHWATPGMSNSGRQPSTPCKRPAKIDWRPSTSSRKMPMPTCLVPVFLAIGGTSINFEDASYLTMNNSWISLDFVYLFIC